MDSQEKFNMLFDSTDTETGVQNAINVFHLLNDTLELLSVTSTNFSKTGQLISASFEAQDATGKKYNQTIRQLTDEVLKLHAASNKLYNEKGFASSQNPNMLFGITNQSMDEQSDNILNRMEKVHIRALSADKQFDETRIAQKISYEQKLSEEVIAFEIKRNNTISAIEQKRQVEMMNQEAKFNSEYRTFLNNRNTSQPTTGPSALGSMFNTASGFIVAQAFLQATTAIKDSITSAEELEIKIGRIQAISVDSGKSIRSWSEEFITMSNRFGESANKIAETTYKIITSGAGNSQHAGNILESALGLSTITGASSDSSAKLITDSINAFKMNATDAKQIGADFFAMIQNGNINFEELSSQFGNVSALTTKLGLSFHDTTAMIKTLTEEGMNTSNAIKAVQSVMNLVLKPSKEMDAVWKDMSVSSFENAVQVYGLAGALQKINDVADKGGITELTTALGSWRTATGVTLFTGGGVDKLKENIENASGSISKLQEQLSKSQDTPGKKLQIETEKIKNYFLEMGEKIIDILSTVNTAIDGVSNIMPQLTAVIVTGTIAFIAFNTAMMFTGTGMLSMIATKIIPLMGSLEALNVAVMAGPAGWVLLAGAIVAFGAYEILTYENSQHAFERYQKEKIESIEQNTAREKDLVNQQTNENLKNIDKEYQAIQKINADARSLYVNTAQIIKDELKNINESLKNTVESDVDIMKNSIKGLEEVISNAKQQIKESEKFLSDFASTRDKKRFDLSIADKTDPEKKKALEGRAQELMKEATQASSESFNTKDLEEQRIFWEESVAKRKEALELADEIGNIDRKNLKEVTNLQEKVLKNNQEKARIERDIAEATRKQIEAQAGLFEKSGQANERRNIKESEAIAKFNESKSKHKNVSALGRTEFNVDYSDQQAQIGLSNSSIKSAEEYKHHIEELTIKYKEINQEGEKLHRQVLDNGAVTAKMPTDAKLVLDIEKQTNEVYKQRIALRKKDQEQAEDEARAKKQNLRDFETFAKEAIKFSFDEKDNKLTKTNAQSQLDKYLTIQNKAEEALGKAGIDPGAQAQLSITLATKEADLRKQVDAVLAINRFDLEAQNIEKSKGLRIKTEKEIGEEKQRWLDRENTTMERIIAEFKAISSKGYSSYDPEYTPVEDTITQLSTKGRSPDLNAAEKLAKTLTSDKEFGDTQVRAEGVLSSIQEYKNAQEKFNALENESAKATDRAAAGISELTSKISDLADMAAIATQTIPTEAPPEQHALGGRTGGWNHWRHGRDRLHAMLTPGESVLNSHATSKFYSQIMGMNQGFPPRTFAGGGAVTTVGDITVNVEGQKTTQSTIRELGFALKRAIQRGEISLS